VTNKIANFMHDESGATAIEYGLIAAILSIGIITVLKNVRTELQNTFTKVKTEMQGATN
jgi:pilus assembly protein Flp/PilA